MPEVRVPCVERQCMLDAYGGDPKIMRRDRMTGAPEVCEQIRVHVRRSLVGPDHRNATLAEKTGELGLVRSRERACAEAGAQLGDDDERQNDFIGTADDLQDVRRTASEVGVPIGVQRELHRQSSSSTARCSASAPSTSASSIHVPEYRSRSWCTTGASAPRPRRNASRATWFKLFPSRRARSRRSRSSATGTKRMVYCLS